MEPRKRCEVGGSKDLISLLNISHGWEQSRAAAQKLPFNKRQEIKNMFSCVYIIRSDADIDLIFDKVIKLIWLGAIQDSGLKTPIFTDNSKYNIKPQPTEYKKAQRI